MNAPSITRDAQIFLGSLLAMIIAAALCSFIVLKTLAKPPIFQVSPFATIFWISLFWTSVTGGLVHARTRCPRFWARVIAAETSLNQRFPLARRDLPAGKREISSSKFLLLTFVLCLGAFLIITVLSAVCYFKYR